MSTCTICHTTTDSHRHGCANYDRPTAGFEIHARVRHIASDWYGTIIDYPVGSCVLIAWDRLHPNLDRWYDVSDLELVR